MEAKFVIPCRELMQTMSGAIEHNLWYCIDFVCTFAMQNPERLDRNNIASLFNLYLDMIYENEDVEGDEKDAVGNIIVEMSTLENRMFVDFVFEMYNQIYVYVIPYIRNGNGVVYTVEHMEVINGDKLLINLDLDEVKSTCALNNIPPLDSSI